MALSYAHAASPAPLIGQTIGENLDHTVDRFPDNTALVSCHQATRYTYAQLAEAVDRLARGLLVLGIEKGDRVGIWSPNSAEWVVTQYAAAKIGAVLVNINPAYRTHELEYVLRHSGCRMLIAATDFKSTSYVDMVEDVRGRLGGLEFVAYFGTPHWTDLHERGESVSTDLLRQRMASLAFDDPINIQYTSGTTGFPKGATLSHHNIVNNGYFIGEGFACTSADRVCIPVPFYHAFGMVLGNVACTTHGATMVVPAAAFDPVATLEAVQAERCTSLYGVPTMFIAELALENLSSFDLSSLRTGMMGGSPCPVEVMKRCIEEMHMREVTIVYGMTETLVSTQTLVDDPIDKRVGTVGKVRPHIEVKVVDPATGLVNRRGEAGELCTRGYSLMLGYWADPERTAEAIDSARWMHTGDLAVMDDEDYVSIVGRIKDMIIRGGENVYPREVEEFLYGHPDIVDVQVIGVPDPKYGEEVMAWVRLRPGAALTVDDLRAYCQGRIARFKIPRYLHVTDEFPMTITGKVQKYKMRADALEILGLADPVTAT